MAVLLSRLPLFHRCCFESSYCKALEVFYLSFSVQLLLRFSLFHGTCPSLSYFLLNAYSRSSVFFFQEPVFRGRICPLPLYRVGRKLKFPPPFCLDGFFFNGSSRTTRCPQDTILRCFVLLVRAFRMLLSYRGVAYPLSCLGKQNSLVHFLI